MDLSSPFTQCPVCQQRHQVGLLEHDNATKEIFAPILQCSGCDAGCCIECSRPGSRCPACSEPLKEITYSADVLVETACGCGIDRGGFQCCIAHLLWEPSDSPQKLVVDLFCGAKFGPGPWCNALQIPRVTLCDALQGWEPGAADRERWNALKQDPPIVYRGFRTIDGWHSLSWSTNPQIAEHFAAATIWKTDNEGPYVAAYKPAGHELVAMIGVHGRGEDEVLLDPRLIDVDRLAVIPTQFD